MGFMDDLGAVIGKLEKIHSGQESLDDVGDEILRSVGLQKAPEGPAAPDAPASNVRPLRTPPVKQP